MDSSRLLADIRARIEALGISRERVAPQLGVTYSWLSKFMQGTKVSHNPRIATVERVLKGLERLENKQRAASSVASDRSPAVQA